MKFVELTPPRVFRTGRGTPIDITDLARVHLAADEQVTFVTESGGQYDVVRKDWGFYATPSLNGRLLDFRLRAALVRGPTGRYHVMLVEASHEPAFEAYLRSEGNVVVRWLDNDADLSAIEADALRDGLVCVCGANRFVRVHTYLEAPTGEVLRVRASDGSYHREVLRCRVCGHFRSVHQMDVDSGPGFYEGAYVNATYGDAQGMRRQFERIVSLPVERSDNAGRVARVIGWTRDHLHTAASPPCVLDVGSGLCVFLHAMKAAGWSCVALDPDERAAEHARGRVGVRAVTGDFFSVSLVDRFDLITLNKVLEHVPDPIAMLARTASLLKPGGLVYVEVPDGEAAVSDADGFGREEFLVDHLHVFSAASTALLAAHAGLDVVELERLREPSSKYTLRALLRPPRVVAEVEG